LTNHFDTIIIGGGLAGLSSAAYLAKNGKKVILFERAKVGGRAITVNMKGFSFNFGAHSLYARDKSYLSKFDKSLDLNIEWLDFNPKKAMYDLGEELSVIPADPLALLQTKMVQGMDKFFFAFKVLTTMLGIEKGMEGLTIKEYFERKKVNPDIQKMLLTLASSNFFTKTPEDIPSNVFFDYYKEIFKTKKPVSYIKGGWGNLISLFENKISEYNGEIMNKTKISKVNIERNKVVSIETNKGEIFTADHYIFCIPPSELALLFKNTALEEQILSYSLYKPTYVMVYDVGLKTIVNDKLSYIYDIENKLFITDISHYDKTCVPEGGQLLQAIAYLSDDESSNNEEIEKIKSKIEEFYDKHFDGWREHLVVPKISKKAIVQEVKWNKEQKGLPIKFDELDNAFFAGDWCQGKGQLSELSFSTSYFVSKQIIDSL
jgi:phytoene dehydrogenase-like protein